MFAAGLVRLIWWALRGRESTFKEPLEMKHVWKSLVGAILVHKHLLAQDKVRWVTHLFIFWGFILLFALSAFIGFTFHLNHDGFVEFLLSPGVKFFTGLWGDLAGLMLLMGVLIALLRRYLIRPEHLITAFDDAVVLWLLLAIIMSGFLLEACRILGEAFLWEQAPVAALLAVALKNVIKLSKWYVHLWIIHLGLSFFLIAYIPYSKLLHMITTPISVFLNVSEEKKWDGTYVG